MPEGIAIHNPSHTTMLAKSVAIRRTACKHIVEQRKRDGLSRRDIEKLFRAAVAIMQRAQLEIANPNQHDHPGSILRGSYDPRMNQGILVVLDSPREGIREVMTIFSREAKRFNKMKIKNRQSSVSGGAASLQQ